MPINTSQVSTRLSDCKGTVGGVEKAVARTSESLASLQGRVARELGDPADRSEPLEKAVARTSDSLETLKTQVI